MNVNDTLVRKVIVNLYKNKFTINVIRLIRIKQKHYPSDMYGGKKITYSICKYRIHKYNV